MLKIDVRTIAGCQELAVRREDRLLQTVLVSVDCAHFASSDWVPDPHRAVVTGRSQPLAVGTEADGAHWLRVPLQAYRFLASGHVPQANDLIPAGAGKRLAIGRERQAEDQPCIRAKGGLLLAGRCVPEFDFPLLRVARIAATRG